MDFLPFLFFTAVFLIGSLQCNTISEYKHRIDGFFSTDTRWHKLKVYATGISGHLVLRIYLILGVFLGSGAVTNRTIGVNFRTNGIIAL